MQIERDELQERATVADSAVSYLLHLTVCLYCNYTVV